MSKTTTKKDVSTIAAEEVRDLNDVEIFRCGDYGKKGVFDEDRIDSIIANYDEDVHEAPVTLDHEQKGPAFGWVSNVRRVGASLFADLKSMPTTLIDCIQKGRFNKRSIEFYEVPEKGEMIRALTFLGAQVPHVKGMETIKGFKEYAFNEDQALKVRVDLPTEFSDLLDPDPSSHDVITKSRWTDSVTEHSHLAHIDEDGNGFTSPPPGEPTGHQHQIVDGEVQPAPTEFGIEHTHVIDMSHRSFFNDEENKTEEPDETQSQEKENDDMSKPETEEKKVETPETPAASPESTPATPETPEATPEAEAPVSREEFAEMKKKLADQEAINRELTNERIRDKREAAFNALFSEALDQRRVVPAEKEGLHALYMNGLNTESKLQFGEGDEAKELTAHELFAQTIKARPAMKSLSTSVGRTPEKFDESKSGDDVQSSSDSKHARAKAYAKENNVEFAEALVEIDKQDQAA